MKDFFETIANGILVLGYLNIIFLLIILLYESKHVFYKNIYLKIVCYFIILSTILYYCLLFSTILYFNLHGDEIGDFYKTGIEIFLIMFFACLILSIFIKKSISFNDLVLLSFSFINFIFILEDNLPPSNDKYPAIMLALILTFLLYLILSCINIIIQITKLIRFLKAKRKKKILEIKNKKS